MDIACGHVPHFGRGMCRNCYMRWYYATHPDYRDRAAKRNARWVSENRDQSRRIQRLAKSKRRTLIKAFLGALKARPCADCGVTYPSEVMEFDHVRGKKEFALSRAITAMVDKEKIRREAEKCDVVCANCHRVRTVSRRSSALAEVA